jgi:hypothetical protein
MKWLKRFFARIGSYLSGRAVRDAEAGIELLRFALPIVKHIADITPTRADDEIVRLFEAYGIPAVDRWLSLPVEHRGRALMHVAAVALKRITPDSVDRIIDFAIQAAVLEVKAK